MDVVCTPLRMSSLLIYSILNVLFYSLKNIAKETPQNYRFMTLCMFQLMEAGERWSIGGRNVTVYDWAGEFIYINQPTLIDRW